MERLTIRHPDGTLLPQCLHCNKAVMGDCGHCDYETQALDRLADYEDIGLTPDEIRGLAGLKFEPLVQVLVDTVPQLVQAIIENLPQALETAVNKAAKEIEEGQP